MNKTTPRFLLLAASLPAAIALSGCTGYTDSELASASVTARKVGPAFELDNCKVQGYRVVTRVMSNGAPANIPDATLFTADCPTAQASASVEIAGKNSVAASARISPKIRAAGVSTDSTSADAADAARRAELTAQVERLSQQQAELTRQLSELQAQLKR